MMIITIIDIIIMIIRSWEELSLAKEHYISFLIVRDPLDRLISCYRDKMVATVKYRVSQKKLLMQEIITKIECCGAKFTHMKCLGSA